MKRLCLVGASTTEGMGSKTGHGWAGNIADTVRATHASYNLGVRGQTVFQIAERAVPECKARILRHDQGAIILGCALNELARLEDGSSRYDTETVLGCYASLMTGLRDIAPVLVIGPPAVEESAMPFFSAASGISLNFRNQDIAAADQRLGQWCEEQAIPFISILPHLLDSSVYRKGLAENDGLHPDDDGYRVVSDLIVAHPAWKRFI